MKATGIVRRIDDLGRVVIPKEIRRTLKIRDGEPLEIFTDAGGSVIFKKYSPAGEQTATAANLCEALFRACGKTVAVCDSDGILASGGALRRELEGKPISPQLEAAMESRKMQRHQPAIPLSPLLPNAAAALTAPMIAGGDLCGCVALLAGEAPPSEDEARIVQAMALFLARQTEG